MIHSSATSSREDIVADHFVMTLNPLFLRNLHDIVTFKFYGYLNFLKLHHISEFHQNLRKCAIFYPQIVKFFISQQPQAIFNALKRT